MYCALAGRAVGIIWIQALLKENRLKLVRKSKLLCDNISAQHIAKNPVQYVREKYIEIDIHFDKDLVL